MQHLQVSAEELSRAERPCMESTVVALLKLCSSNKADIKVADDGIELVVQGGPASVQPTRRGRGAGGRGGVSSLLWPDGFTWALTVRLTDVESLSQLSEPPELRCTCATCEDSSKPLETAANALKFMEDHSGHNSSWSSLLGKQFAALEQDLTQPLQQVQQHSAEGLVLPIQRAAALVSVEVAHMLLLSPEHAQNDQLKQLALAILHHRILWHMTSSYRPAKSDDLQQLQLAVGPSLSPHLLWLVAGAPPYSQSASAAPQSAKHCSLEARALVAYMRRCGLFQQPSKKSAVPVAAPTDLQLLTGLQQMLQSGLSTAGSSGGSAAARVSNPSSQPSIDAEFIDDLLSLRGLELHHLVQAADEAGTSSQLDFCVMCGSSSSTTQERLMHCKSCCHSYHANCALAAGNADGSYTMQTYPKVREGICLGCQHFPLRSEAEGGFNWEAAAEDAETEAAAAAAAGAAKHIARAKGSTPSGATRTLGAAAIAAAVAAAAAADRPGGGSSSGAKQAQAVSGTTAVKAEPGVRPTKPLAASTAANSSSSGGSGGNAAKQANKHMVRGPNGKFVSLKQQQEPSGSTPTPSRPPAAAQPAAAAAGKETFARPGSSSGSKPKKPSTSSGTAPAAAAAAANTSAAAIITPQGAHSNSSKTTGKVVLCCEPLIPGSEAPEAPEAVDIDQLRQHVLHRLHAINLQPTGDSGMLLRRALLREGIKLDYIDNQGRVAAARFEVVTAAAGRKGDKQQLLCHACVKRHLATWKEAEDHLAYDSGGHSTQYLKFIGTKTSVKDLWQQVQEIYKLQQHPQQNGHSNLPVSPAMDAAHALQMLATACALPFGETAAADVAAAAAIQEQQQRKERKERVNGAAGSPSPTSSLNAADVAAAVAGTAAAARKRSRGDKDVDHRRASSSNVSDTITAPLTDASPSDETNPRKRQRQQQQEEVDPIALRWQLARVPPVIRQQLEQLLSSTPSDLQVCAVLVKFWAPGSSSSSSSGGSSPAAAAGSRSPAISGATAAAAAGGSSSPTAAVDGVNWDLKGIQSDGIPGLLVDLARGSLCSSSNSSSTAGDAAGDVLECCLAAVKAAYSQPAEEQQQQQQQLLQERRQLVLAMLQLGLKAVSNSSSSRSSAAASAELLAVAVTPVSGSRTSADKLQQLHNLCDLLQQLIGSVGSQVWSSLAAAWAKHSAAAGALGDANLGNSNAGLTEVHMAAMHALQQLLELIKQSPAAWEPALVRICSSSSNTGSTVLEVMFDAFYKGYQLQQQCDPKQGGQIEEQQQQQQDEDPQQVAADPVLEQQQQQQVMATEHEASQQLEQQHDEEQADIEQSAEPAAAAQEDVHMADAAEQDDAEPAAAAAEAAANPEQEDVADVAQEQQQQQEHEVDMDASPSPSPAAAAPSSPAADDACVSHEQENQQQKQHQQQEQQQQQLVVVGSEAANQERLKAAEVLLGGFIAALTAATAWLISKQRQQQQQQHRDTQQQQQQQQDGPQHQGMQGNPGQQHKAEDLLVNLVGLQYQVLHALLLTDTQLHDVLRFVNGGLHTSLVEYAGGMLQKARRVFRSIAGGSSSSGLAPGGDMAAAVLAELAVKPEAEDEATAAADASAIAAAAAAGGEDEDEQQQSGVIDCGVLAYDCKYVADTLAETVGYVVRHSAKA